MSFRKENPSPPSPHTVLYEKPGSKGQRAFAFINTKIRWENIL